MVIHRKASLHGGILTSESRIPGYFAMKQEDGNRHGTDSIKVLSGNLLLEDARIKLRGLYPRFNSQKQD